jgi:hypothetical protein
MPSNTNELCVVITVPNEFEAGLVLDLLLDEGIDARADGGYTSDFRIGVAGSVRVLVHVNDAERAQHVLHEVQHERSLSKRLDECDTAHEAF